MFSFHKPRIYRSASGCCICRAKSSSSRFTDSRRYEGDFYACFKLNDKSAGDICNACVLLVKRWKKLPKGSLRNWHHVVDARAGHGSKPMSKINKKKPCAGIGVIAKIKQPSVELTDKMRSAMRKHVNPSESFISSLGRARDKSPSGCSDDVQMDCISSESGSYHSSLAASPTPSEVGEDEVAFNSPCAKKPNASNSRPLQQQQLVNTSGGLTKGSKVKDIPHKQRRNSDASHSSFLDLSFWKREKTCCGIIFKGPCGEVLLDRRFLSPCFLRSVKNGNGECQHSGPKQKPVYRPNKSETSVTGTEIRSVCPVAIKANGQVIPVDCISVDSGYEDSSNSNPDAFKPLTKNGINGKSLPIDSASSIREASSIIGKTNISSPVVVISSIAGGEQTDLSIGKPDSCTVTQTLQYEPSSTISTN